MALELHIWGPAFGLPSIDPQCIAAVAYLAKLALPEEIEWMIVPDYDASKVPNSMYTVTLWDPYSSDDSTQRNFPRFLTARPGYADTTPFLASFIQQHAQPLLDLTLYVSYENYHTTTSPAFTKILPRHTNYIVPPTRRNAARARTSYLGLTSLDIDTLHDSIDTNASISAQYEAVKKEAERGGPGTAERQSILPFGRKRLRNLLHSPEHADRFKLDSLANSFLQPLNDVLGDREWLISDDEPPSVDCLAFGYLALMVYPPLPQTWLVETVRSRFPKIHTYVQRARQTLLGPEETSAEVIMALSQTSRPLSDQRSQLPWYPPPRPTILAATQTIGTQLLHRLPGQPFKQLISHSPPPSTIEPDGVEAEGMHRPQHPQTLPSTLIPTLFAVSAALVGMLAGAVYYVPRVIEAGHGGHEFFREVKVEGEGSATEKTTRFADLGEAGAALSVLSEQMAFEAAYQRERESEMGRVTVEGVGVGVAVDVDVDVEGDGRDGNRTGV
ncbi:hypothetical protein LTS18_012528 [Coniosporium uncinatum]|uniref:Uncharacterized protein n=1 Tax=Coniosporium uncinatum TaxID=93489 RepID=A0ACC3DVW5_9PEZI|nr:hypothetical protein LTS18_012528 [Coniosporium uncinatum]